MTLKTAAAILGVEIPEGMERYESEAQLLCTEELIDSLQEKFDLYGEFYEEIKSAFHLIQKDPTMVKWLSCACRYYKDADHDHARDLPCPVLDGSAEHDLLPLMVLLPTIEDAYENYRKKGFSHDEAVRFLGNVKHNLFLAKTRMLGRTALTSGYFRWLAHYLKCTIFDHGGLNFEMKKTAKANYYIKNKASGEIVILAVRSAVHRDGMPLGCAGFEDEADSFFTAFRETDEAFIGHPVSDFRIQREAKSYPKSEWELFLSPDQDVINVHIPRNTDISPDKVRLAYREALEITKKTYPEHSPIAFTCSSWLMDPTLKEILGEDSRIAQFSKPYLRAPNKSAGKEIFSFVFRPSDAANLNSLPENTRLERRLKEMYLSGKYVYAYMGMMPFDKI